MNNTLFPFSPIGVEEWQTQLYASSDQEVHEEAAAAGADLAGWLPTRFTLSEEQLQYLKGISPSILNHWGGSLAYFIGHRLSIVLIKPDRLSSPEVRSWKRVTSDDQVPSENERQAGDPGALLTFTISY